MAVRLAATSGDSMVDQKAVWKAVRKVIVSVATMADVMAALKVGL